MAVGLGYARRLTDRLDVAADVKHVSEGISGARISWVALDVGTQFRTGLYGLTIGATVRNVGASSRMKGSAVERKINSDDLGPQQSDVTFSTEDTELPTLFRFSVGTDLVGGTDALLGGAGGPHRLVAELASSDAIDTDIQAALGVEYGFRNLVFLRAGKRWYGDERDVDASGAYGLSGGMGVRLPLGRRNLRFDYAYTSLGDLKNVQVFSFEFGH
jgi:hypothetical protein